MVLKRLPEHWCNSKAVLSLRFSSDMSAKQSLLENMHRQTQARLGFKPVCENVEIYGYMYAFCVDIQS